MDPHTGVWSEQKLKAGGQRMRWKAFSAWQTFSIRTKLSLMYLGNTLLLLLLIFALLSFNEQGRLEKNLSADLSTLSKMMGINSSAALLFEDAKTATNVLHSLRSRPNIVRACLFDADGFYLAGYIRDANLSAPTHLDKFYPEHKLMDSVALSDGIVNLGEHLKSLRSVDHDGQVVGFIYLESDLGELEWNLDAFMSTLLIVLGTALLLAVPLIRYFQRVLTSPLLDLHKTIYRVSKQGDYSLRAPKCGSDEVGEVIDGFNFMLGLIQLREHEISGLNAKLSRENRRMSAEIDISRKMQRMLLPARNELQNLEDLEVAAFMEPATEVGGDYYDVLHQDGHVKIGIGDVTGHGLESGMVMLMVQMAVRTLFTHQVADPTVFLQVLNRTLYDNFQRMDMDKNMTLSLMDYHQGKLNMYGQHEEVLLVRTDGRVERLDTLELGFMVGMLPDIEPYVQAREIELAAGEGIVLYTDGVTEAVDSAGIQYGLPRLCEVVAENWYRGRADKIKQAVLADLWRFIGNQEVYDDISLLILIRTGQACDVPVFQIEEASPLQAA